MGDVRSSPSQALPSESLDSGVVETLVQYELSRVLSLPMGPT